MPEPHSVTIITPTPEMMAEMRPEAIEFIESFQAQLIPYLRDSITDDSLFDVGREQDLTDTLIQLIDPRIETLDGPPRLRLYEDVFSLMPALQGKTVQIKPRAEIASLSTPISSLHLTDRDIQDLLGELAGLMTLGWFYREIID